MGKAQARFHWLTGDVNWTDYGGKWVRQVGERRWHIIDLCNLREACGRDATETYAVDLAEVDLDQISGENVQSALRSWGMEVYNELDNPLMLVEILHSYGLKAPLWNDCGNAYAPLLKQARAESHALDDEEAHEAAMMRPVNAMGSTALEFMRGDFKTALIRGLAEGTAEARIIGKMHGLEDEDMDSIKGDPDLKKLGLE